MCIFQGEGVAYRGRVLIELETKMDTQPTKLVEDVLSDDIVRVQVCRIPEGRHPERFSIECYKAKTKVITLANNKGARNTVNQSKLEM